MIDEEFSLEMVQVALLDGLGELKVSDALLAKLIDCLLCYSGLRVGAICSSPLRDDPAFRFLPRSELLVA